MLLLLGVSIAIIIRSLILRRRFRQRVQEAIANGVLIPGLMTEPLQRELGEKPKMWNVWIGSPDHGLRNAAATGDEDSDMPAEDGLQGTLVHVISRTYGRKLTNHTACGSNQTFAILFEQFYESFYSASPVGSHAFSCSSNLRTGTSSATISAFLPSPPTNGHSHSFSDRAGSSDGPSTAHQHY